MSVICNHVLVPKKFLMQNPNLIEENKSNQGKGILDSEDVISFQTEIPKSIQNAMKNFIDEHPNWDQYRLLQAALAGFLVQNGITS